MIVRAVLCCVAVSVLFIIGAASKPHLLLSNNGPAVLEWGFINFCSYLENSTEVNLNYTFDDGVQKMSSIASHPGGYECWETNFPHNLYSEGWYNMTVTVTKKKLFFHEVIASNSTAFQLGENLFGHIVVLRNESSTNEAEEVGTDENLTMIAKIHNPIGNLKDIQCIWSIDMERHRHNGTNLTYIYKDPGMSNIVVAVFASVPSGKTLFGMFTKELNVKVPVKDVNVTGNPFLHHDEVLHLNATCDGTPPFEYCWDIISSNETVEKNFTCTVIVTNTCFFPIDRYFQKDGSYHIAIHVSNDVNFVKKDIKVVVYSVSRKPQLLTVIIPIVCSLLTLIIIAAGITYYRQQRKQLIVEVASFDFHDNSEIYPERTFFEQLWDSFRCRSCYSSTTCVEREISSPEREPLLT